MAEVTHGGMAQLYVVFNERQRDSHDLLDDADSIVMVEHLLSKSEEVFEQWRRTAEPERTSLLTTDLARHLDAYCQLNSDILK